MATPIITRAQWGARPARNTTALAGAAQRGVALHYSAAEADMVTDHAKCYDRVRGIQAFHMDGRGWADIAYNWLTCRHGFRFVGRGLGVRSAAQGTNDGNAEYHAVCFLGLDKEGRTDVTPAAKEATLDCIQAVRARYPQATAVKPHSSFHSTECPGNEFRAWISAGIPSPQGADLTPEQDARLKDIQTRLANIVDPKADRSLRKRADDIEKDEKARDAAYDSEDDAAVAAEKARDAAQDANLASIAASLGRVEQLLQQIVIPPSTPEA